MIRLIFLYHTVHLCHFQRCAPCCLVLKVHSETEIRKWLWQSFPPNTSLTSANTDFSNALNALCSYRVFYVKLMLCDSWTRFIIIKALIFALSMWSIFIRVGSIMKDNFRPWLSSTPNHLHRKFTGVDHRQLLVCIFHVPKCPLTIL